jgi:hypothetical protein
MTTNTFPIQDFDPALHPAPDAPQVYWSDPSLARITRCRFVSDPGFPFWDLSYCYGILRDGTPVRVQVPFFQVPKSGMSRHLVEAAKRDGVFAKGLGLLDAVSVCQ